MAKSKKKVRVKAKRRVEGGSTRKILVSLPGGPQVVVDAHGHDDAFEQYKEVAGIVQSDHMPRFKLFEEDGDLIVNEKGVVVDSTGQPILGSTGKSDFEDEDYGDDDSDE